MTAPALPLYPDDELVAAAWIASIPGFTTAMVGPVLPPDANPDGTAAAWISTGYVTVTVAGGTPDPALPRYEPVIDVQCWAAVPGSNRPPWQMARALANAITQATRDRHGLNRPVAAVVNGVVYPPASVQGAQVLTSFRRLYADAADYACLHGDLWLSWIALRDVIP